MMKPNIVRGVFDVLVFPIIIYLEIRERLENTPWKMK